MTASTARAAVASWLAQNCYRYRGTTLLAVRCEQAGIPWGMLPRRLRREHARILHASRTLATTWPEQWAATLAAGRHSIG